MMMMIMPLVKITSIHVAEPPKQKLREVRTNEPRREGDVNQAISMVSYYASSSEPAQIRGKTVYIQYSNRHEIVNNQSPGEVPGNVLFLGHL
ncbi:BnaCnng65230D [Brassica napus]|uniref:BnaCnng65230D protein n=2 Tax=Brassica TaxID=3705 RepID=A0A078JSJ4_BRANA|nr:unnamed protein product [Brassica napus]CDY69764.1 BnaCnng65230D [Brassica napus]